MFSLAWLKHQLQQLHRKGVLLSNLKKHLKKQGPKPIQGTEAQTQTHSLLRLLSLIPSLQNVPFL